MEITKLTTVYAQMGRVVAFSLRLPTSHLTRIEEREKPMGASIASKVGNQEGTGKGCSLIFADL